jgi:hypothetical protein
MLEWKDRSDGTQREEEPEDGIAIVTGTPRTTWAIPQQEEIVIQAGLLSILDVVR